MVASPRANPYHRLSIAGKQAAAREQLAEPPMSCPSDCGTRLQPADVLPHLKERCPGPRPPGPGSTWVDWRGAIATGVPPVTLHDWVRRGAVRVIGPRQSQKYLLRDLVSKVAIRRLSRRR
jgi:hypothetical protein